MRFWILQARAGAQWDTDILPAWETARQWRTGATPDALAITAVDRAGNAGPPAVLQRAGQAAR